MKHPICLMLLMFSVVLIPISEASPPIITIEKEGGGDGGGGGGAGGGGGDGGDDEAAMLLIKVQDFSRDVDWKSTEVMMEAKGRDVSFGIWFFINHGLIDVSMPFPMLTEIRMPYDLFEQAGVDSFTIVISDFGGNVREKTWDF